MYSLPITLIAMPNATQTSSAGGPQPQTRAERQRLVERIVQDLHRVHGDQIIAIGLYGSLARGLDQPYSDVELFCVIAGSGIDYSHEWIYGAGKAEVNIYSPDVIRHGATEVDDRWSLSQGQLMVAQPLYGEATFFQELRELVLSPPATAFNDLIRAMIVGELYEWMGKLRNARHTGYRAYIPLIACHFAEHTGLMLGLAHRHCFTTGGKVLEESVAFPHRPDGFAELCTLIMAGQLHDSDAVTAALERCWVGVVTWATEQGITLETGWPLG